MDGIDGENIMIFTCVCVCVILSAYSYDVMWRDTTT